MSVVRVGLMVPANNTTLEREMLGWLPAGSSCTTVRIPRAKGLLTTETLPEYQAEALRLAEKFSDDSVDVVAYGCTAAGFIAGPAADHELEAQLRLITRKPVVTTAHAMVSALSALGAKHIALVTPYSDTVNDRLKIFLSDAGIEVQSFNSFYAVTVDELGRITASEVAAFARRTMTRQCDAMFIACAQLPTQGILAELESEFHRPVASSNSSIARYAIQASGHRHCDSTRSVVW